MRAFWLCLSLSTVVVAFTVVRDFKDDQDEKFTTAHEKGLQATKAELQMDLSDLGRSSTSEDEKTTTAHEKGTQKTKAERQRDLGELGRSSASDNLQGSATEESSQRSRSGFLLGVFTVHLVAGGFFSFVATFFLVWFCFLRVLPKGDESQGNASQDDEADAKWLDEWNEPTPTYCIVWVLYVLGMNVYFQTWMIYYYAEDAEDMCTNGKGTAWAGYLLLQVGLILLAYVLANFVFPVLPMVGPIPLFLPAFILCTCGCVYPYLFTDVGKHVSRNAPLWMLMFWGCNRATFESCVQMHANAGVKGISDWLLWPIQSCKPYTVTYLNKYPVTRARGGNPDASSSFFFGLHTTIITIATIGNTPGPDAWEKSKLIVVLNFITQTWMFLALLWGPGVHITGGMPGMSKENLLNQQGTPREQTRTHGMMRGCLGMIMLWLASYCIVAHCVFYRSQIESPGSQRTRAIFERWCNSDTDCAQVQQSNQG